MRKLITLAIIVSLVLVSCHDATKKKYEIYLQDGTTMVVEYGYCYVDVDMLSKETGWVTCYTFNQDDKFSIQAVGLKRLP